MALKFGCSLSVILLIPVLAQADLKLDPKYMKEVARCETKGDPQVYFVKQWHLSPGVDTKNAVTFAPYPQLENQEAIFNQLDSWIEKKQLSTLIAEGCEGELTESSKIKFNNWSVEDLSQRVSKAGYSKILSSVPLKLEAKYKTKIHTYCGDSELLIKDALLSFSDARADLGYLSRLSKLQGDAVKVRPYLEGAIEAYHLPKKTKVNEAMIAVKADLKKTIASIESDLSERNASVMIAVQKVTKETNVPLPVVIVFGGMHAQGLKHRLDEKKIPCVVLEPVGYHDDEEKLLAELHSAINSL